MDKNASLNDEIELLREEMNSYIDNNGLTESDTLLNLSKKLDEVIVRWIKEKGKGPKVDI